MANENEIKFVVGSYAELEALLTPFGWVDIEQGYLNPDNRVRRITHQGGLREHYFTFKKRLPNGHNLEIEPEIKPHEFEEAWQYTIERLHKRRVSIEHDGLRWDVDFYRWSQPYFVVAEVEMPSDMELPSAILPHIQEHIILQVPRDDGRFAARRLANEEFARYVAQELGLLREPRQGPSRLVGD